MEYQTKILDHEDQDDYWKNIISYLKMFQVPNSVPKCKLFIKTTRRYFLCECALWRQNNNAILQRVILDTEWHEDLIRQAHEESGHQGRETQPTRNSSTFTSGQICLLKSPYSAEPVSDANCGHQNNLR